MSEEQSSTPAPTASSNPLSALEVGLTDAEKAAFGGGFTRSIQMGITYGTARDPMAIPTPLKERYPHCDFRYFRKNTGNAKSAMDNKGYVPVPGCDGADPDVPHFHDLLLGMTPKVAREVRAAEQRAKAQGEGRRIQDRFDRTVKDMGGRPMGRISGPDYYPSETEHPGPVNEWGEQAAWERAREMEGRRSFGTGNVPIGPQDPLRNMAR